VIIGDCEVSRGTAHSAFYFTKSEVKGKNKNMKEMPDFTGKKRCRPCIFTPDSGVTGDVGADGHVDE
jgi:hypothetical protein